MYCINQMMKEFIPGFVREEKADERIIYEFIPSYGVVNYYDSDGYCYDDYLLNNDDSTKDESSFMALDENYILLPSSTEYEETDTATEVTSEQQIDDSLVTVDTLAPSMPVATGIVYDSAELADYDFLLSNLYNVASSTNIRPDELDTGKLLNMDFSIDTSSDDYKVLIYHTHASEAFIDSREGVTEDTIVGVGDELSRILNDEYGIKTYHDRTIYDMSAGYLDRSTAYDYSGAGIDKILAEHPSIEVILDIHRDGVDESVHLVRNVDGRPTAQIMFLNGVSRLNMNGDIDYLYNPYKLDNLGFSLQMQLAGREMYGDLMRRIFISGYCYNLDRVKRASLIEVGAQTNTVEEAKNAMIPLAAVLYSVIAGN